MRAAFLAFALWCMTGVAAAQPVALLRLSCDFGSVIDVWVIDLARSTARFAGWVETVPASITDDAILWEYHRGELTHRYYINRYSGVADVQSVATSGRPFTYTGRGQCEAVQERAF